MGDVYMLNGKILSGLPNHAKDIEFDNTGTTLNSTNTEDAIKEVNSKLVKEDTFSVTTDNAGGALISSSRNVLSAKITSGGYVTFLTYYGPTTTWYLRVMDTNDQKVTNTAVSGVYYYVD